MIIKTIKSPAKINLALDLLYKRADGFHEIDTIMAKIDFCDIIEVYPYDYLKVECDGVSEEENIVYKCLKKVEEYIGDGIKLRFKILKKIPMGAGLAGGSSNAGVILRYIYENYQISFEKILEIGAIYGSDVNFFIYGCDVARCTGKGEIIMPLETGKIPYNVNILKSNIHSSTIEVYKNFNISEKEDNISVSNLVNQLLQRKWKDFDRLKFNVLEKPAFKVYKDLSEEKARIFKEEDNVMMSGSGASFFILNKKDTFDKSFENKVDINVNFWREDEQ